jgi:hypothetical protein
MAVGHLPFGQHALARQIDRDPARRSLIGLPGLEGADGGCGKPVAPPPVAVIEMYEMLHATFDVTEAECDTAILQWRRQRRGVWAPRLGRLWRRAIRGAEVVLMRRQRGDRRLPDEPKSPTMADQAAPTGGAMEISEIRAGVVYETARGQRRKVIRVTRSAVVYDVLGVSRPFYRFSLLKQAFADEVEYCEE